jgi:hypothetical protein
VALSGVYRGLYASVEGIASRSRPSPESNSVDQWAFVADAAYRFPIFAQGLELGTRFDAYSVEMPVGPSADLMAVSAVSNLYVWRHRAKGGTLVRYVFSRDPDGQMRPRQEALMELSLGF